MQQFISELQQQAIIWLHLLSWVALMLWIHTPSSRPPRPKIPARYVYSVIGMLLAVNAVASAIRLMNL